MAESGGSHVRPSKAFIPKSRGKPVKVLGSEVSRHGFEKKILLRMWRMQK